MKDPNADIETENLIYLNNSNKKRSSAAIQKNLTMKQ